MFDKNAMVKHSISAFLALISYICSIEYNMSLISYKLVFYVLILKEFLWDHIILDLLRLDTQVKSKIIDIESSFSTVNSYRFYIEV